MSDSLTTPMPRRIHAERRKGELVYELLETAIQEGHLEIRTSAGERRSFGPADGRPRASWEIHRPELWKRLMRGGRVALGESYEDGWWDGDDLAELLGVFLRNRLDSLTSIGLGLRLKLALAALAASPRSLVRARRSIEYHYDLGNEFFARFLDPTMTYSCGYTIADGDSLETLQHQKYARVARKLGLERGGRLLDVGCGWGGMLIHAATHFPEIEGLGITLSTRQASYARAKIAELGLGDRLRVELRDYRELEGRFEFISSIGMFEHVGRTQYPLFMKRMAALLAPGGTGLLHTMGVSGADGFKIDPWLSRYVFPGAEVPHLEDLSAPMRRAGLVVAHVENLKLHYAETLRRWAENFDASLEAPGTPEIDGRFARRWRYYLKLCEAGFRHGSMQLYQCLFTRDGDWPFERTFEF